MREAVRPQRKEKAYREGHGMGKGKGKGKGKARKGLVGWSISQKG